MRKIFQFNLLSLVTGIWLIAAMLIQYPELDAVSESDQNLVQDYSVPLIKEDRSDEARLRALRIVAMNSQARREAGNRKSLNLKYLANLKLACNESK